MSYISKKEIDEIKPQIEKAVHKFLGFGESAIVTAAINCITSGYDKRKTAGTYCQALAQPKLYFNESIDYRKIVSFIGRKKIIKINREDFQHLR